MDKVFTIEHNQILASLNGDPKNPPILLIHGKDDTIVPIGQSERMSAALKDAGKPAELIELAGQDHWLKRQDTRIATLKASVAFVEAHNPPN